MKRLLVCLLLFAGMVTDAQMLDAPVPILTGEAIPTLNALYPTDTALNEAIVPPADRLDIARRLTGYTAPVIRTGPEPLAAGTIRTFNMIDTARNATQSVSVELVSVGDYAYVWVEQPVTVDIKAVDRFLRRFDEEIYPRVRELWGSEPTPGIDGETRLYIVFTRFINPTVDGYFTSQHTYPADISPGSNQHEMIIFNLNQFQHQMDSDRLLSRSAHEFQHMVRHHVDGNESSWVDEGFSVFTETLLGYAGNADMAQEFLAAPNTQLNNWTGSLASYGGSLLFMGYFYERFGLAGLQRLSAEPLDGLAGVDHALRGLSGEGVDSFFADWVLALLMQRPDLELGYHDWATWWGTLTPLGAGGGGTLPFTVTDETPQYSTQVYAFDQLQGAATLRLTLEKPTEVSLLPDVSPRGQFYMYGNVGDESDTTLTRAFDLRGLTSATLRYGVWHNLETYWDYAYVMVSTDGGQRWDIVPTLRTTADNPNQRAYGVGYTGSSLGWKGDQADLTPYIGQEVLVRFEMITDDAKTQPGIALDEITVPELGYSEDFENGDGGWQMTGWVRSDNRLPQRAWLQVIQFAGDITLPTRYLIDDTAHVELALLPGVERVMVTVSPFAPVTTVPMPYTLSVAAG